MAGAKKRTLNKDFKESKARKGLNFEKEEHEEHGNGKQTKGSKRQKLSSPKTKSSPRKLAKRDKKERNGVVRVVFEEDNDEVTVEVDGVESEFPMPTDKGEGNPADRNGNGENSKNNNASVATNKVSRADRFRKKVNTASQMFDQDKIEESDNEVVFQYHNSSYSQNSSAEEGETRTSSDDWDDTRSETSSVKIRPMTQEEKDEEHVEYEKAKEAIITQAVDKSFEKLTQFMKESGLVFRQEDHSKGKGKAGNNNQKRIRNERTEVEAEPSGSGTTIYDNAIMPENETQKRASTSSEEINTSDELMEVQVMEDVFNNMNLIADRAQQGRDRFYDRPPQPGGSSRDRSEHSNKQQPTSQQEKEQQMEHEARGRADELIRNAEASKARILDPQSKDNFILNKIIHAQKQNNREVNQRILAHRENRENSQRARRANPDDGYESEEEDDNGQGNYEKVFHHPAVVDENYLVIGNHVEEHIRQ